MSAPLSSFNATDATTTTARDGDLMGRVASVAVVALVALEPLALGAIR